MTMSTVIGIFKFILACIPFVVLLLLVRRVDRKKADRAKQFPMPLVALAYCLVLTVLLVWLGSDPFGLVDKASALMSWLVNALESRIPKLASLLSSATASVVAFVEKYLVFLTNAVIVLIFLIVKAICIPLSEKIVQAIRSIWRRITGKIWGSSAEPVNSRSFPFYEFDETYQRWFLQERFRDLQSLIRAFYLATLLTAVVLLALSQQFPGWYIFSAPLYPCLIVLMLGEVDALLGGLTRSEYEEDVMGEDSLSKRVVDLSKLRELLKQLFGDRLLLEGTEMEHAGREGVVDLLEELDRSEAPADRIAVAYFQSLRTDGPELNVDDILSARALLEGKSVLFCDPFYRDLTQYFLLPMSDALMHRRKCLVIAGRKSTEPEIRGWIEQAVRDHLKMSGLWRVGSVEDEYQEHEICILTFSQLYDLEMLSARRDLFRQVSFVLMLEPSMILATGQVGLSLVVNYCEEGGEKPTYCMCDRNCDGLVDTLSHLIKQSITTVAATEAPICLHSEMCWSADGPYLSQRIMPDISRYLGVGTELAAVCAKDQVPRVVWRSEKKFPVVDMKWIAGQYHQSICQYSGLPMGQESVYRTIGFEADLWGTPKEKTACIIVEDEFCNLLEMVRLFQTRATEESFVNVIAENYLLRDYMKDNWRIFAADRKAIPTIVPDYARTERNTTLRLLMMLEMSESIPAETVEKELRLLGIETDDPCETLNELIQRYTTSKYNQQQAGDTQFVRQLDVIAERRDSVTGIHLERGVEVRLRLRDKQEFIEKAGSFRTAYFITEDDKENSSYMDAKLFGHIYQYILPGQFFTYDGKYYEVRSVTPEKGVLVRRAADHIVGRRYYRQKRTYHLEWPEGDAVSDRSRIVNGLELTTCTYEVSVETNGYLEMDESNDLRRAREVVIADDGRQGSAFAEYVRIYSHKNVLRIRFPGASEEVRYTLCMLLMEVFRTVYADAWHYLAAVTPQTEKTRDALRGVLYSVDSPSCGADGSALLQEDCIYIIEDSDVDMGLLESVDRNIIRLLGIVADHLDWHDEKMTTPDPVEAEPEEIDLSEAGEEKHGLLWRIKNFFKRIAAFFRRLFGKIAALFRRLFHREKKTGEGEGEAAPESGETAETASEDDILSGDDGDDEDIFGRGTSGDKDDIFDDDGDDGNGSGGDGGDDGGSGDDLDDTDDIDNEGISGKTHFSKAILEPETERPAGDPADEGAPPEGEIGGEDEQVRRHSVDNRYQHSCFLLYGYDQIAPEIAAEATLELLRGMGFDDNELYRARKGEPPRSVVATTEAQCDFCGLPLSGVAYDVLEDGRMRCVTCSSSAIHTVDEFRSLYKRVRPTMESFYNIQLGMAVRVRTADARTINRQVGAVYKPTRAYDARVVGFARQDKDGLSLYIENGAPRLAAIETIVHELTHIWQYSNWDGKKMRRSYGKARDVIYEGMAMWASIQFLYLIGETDYAQRKEAVTLQREDAYGEGFRLYCKKYPLSHSSVFPARSPFHTDPPL